jgi:hypothetical protein
MKVSTEVLEGLYPDVQRVVELVVGAFEGQDIPNGAIILGLSAVIGLTLNRQMPGTHKYEAPEIAEIIPYLEAGMEFGRDIELGLVQ